MKKEMKWLVETCFHIFRSEMLLIKKPVLIFHWSLFRFVHNISNVNLTSIGHTYVLMSLKILKYSLQKYLKMILRYVVFLAHKYHLSTFLQILAILGCLTCPQILTIFHFKSILNQIEEVEFRSLTNPT